MIERQNRIDYASMTQDSKGGTTMSAFSSEDFIDKNMGEGIVGPSEADVNASKNPSKENRMWKKFRKLGAGIALFTALASRGERVAKAEDGADKKITVINNGSIPNREGLDYEPSPVVVEMQVAKLTEGEIKLREERFLTEDNNSHYEGYADSDENGKVVLPFEEGSEADTKFKQNFQQIIDAANSANIPYRILFAFDETNGTVATGIILQGRMDFQLSNGLLQGAPGMGWAVDSAGNLRYLIPQAPLNDEMGEIGFVWLNKDEIDKLSKYSLPDGTKITIEDSLKNGGFMFVQKLGSKVQVAITMNGVTYFVDMPGEDDTDSLATPGPGKIATPPDLGLELTVKMEPVEEISGATVSEKELEDIHNYTPDGIRNMEGVQPPTAETMGYWRERPDGRIEVWRPGMRPDSFQKENYEVGWLVETDSITLDDGTTVSLELDPEDMKTRTNARGYYDMTFNEHAKDFLTYLIDTYYPNLKGKHIHILWVADMKKTDKSNPSFVQLYVSSRNVLPQEAYGGYEIGDNHIFSRVYEAGFYGKGIAGYPGDQFAYGVAVSAGIEYASKADGNYLKPITSVLGPNPSAANARYDRYFKHFNEK